MSQKVTLSKVSKTELEARFAELTIVLRREYNAHRRSQSRIKQLLCARDLKNIELKALKTQSIENRLKVQKYRNLYGDIDHILNIDDDQTGDSRNKSRNKSHDESHDESTGSTASTSVISAAASAAMTTQSLQRTINTLTAERDGYKSQMESLQKSLETRLEMAITQKTAVLNSENEQLRLKVGHLETQCRDKADAVQRYEHRIQSLSDALNRSHSESAKNGKDEASDPEPDSNPNSTPKSLKASNPRNSTGTSSDSVDSDESDIATMQRMYQDQITQLQHQIDRINTELSVSKGNTVRLELQRKDSLLRIQKALEREAYLKGNLEREQKSKSILNDNVLTQQRLIGTLQRELAIKRDHHNELHLKYTDIKLELDILKHRAGNFDSENLNYRVMNAELKKLISGLKGDAKTWRERYESMHKENGSLEETMKTLRSQLEGSYGNGGPQKRQEILKENEELKNVVYTMKQQIATLECDVDRLGKQLEISQKNENLIPGMKAEIEQLQEQLEEAKSTAQEAVRNLDDVLNQQEISRNPPQKRRKLNSGGAMVGGITSDSVTHCEESQSARNAKSAKTEVTSLSGHSEGLQHGVATTPSSKLQRRHSMSLLQDNEDLLEQIGNMEAQCTDKSRNMERLKQVTVQLSDLRRKLRESRQTAAKLQLENEGLSHQMKHEMESHHNKTRDLSQQIDDLQQKLNGLQGVESTKNKEIEDLKKRYTKTQGMYQRELRNHAKARQTLKQLQSEMTQMVPMKEQSQSSQLSPQSGKSGISAVSVLSPCSVTQEMSPSPNSKSVHIAVLEAELAAFQSTAERLKIENRSLSEEIISVKEQLQSPSKIPLNLMTQQNVDDGNGLKSNISIISVEVFNQLQSKCTAKTKEVDDLRDVLKMAEAQSKEYSTQCNKLKAENQNLSTKLKAITKEKEELYQRNTLYLTAYPQIDPDELDTAKSEVESLTKQLDELQQRIESKTTEDDQHRIKSKEKEQAQEKRIETVQSECDQLRAEIAEHLSTIQSLEATVAKKEGEIGKYQQFEESARKSKGLLEQMKDILTKKTKEITNLQQQMRTKTDSFNSRMKAQEQGFAVKKKEMERLIGTLREQIKVQQIETEKLIEKQKESDSTKITELEDENDVLKQIRSSLQEKVRTKEAGAAEYNLKIKGLNAENKKLRDVVKAKVQELEELKKEKSQSVEAVEVTIKQKESLKEQFETVESELKEKEKALESITEKYKESVEESKKYLNKSIEKLERIKELEKALDSKSAICDNLEQKLEAFKVKMSEMETSLKEFESTLETEQSDKSKLQNEF